MPLGCALVCVAGEILGALPGAARLIERRRSEIAERHVDVGEPCLFLSSLPKRLQGAFAEWRTAASGEDIQRNLAPWQLRRSLEDRADRRRDFVCPLDSGLARLDNDLAAAYLAEQQKPDVRFAHGRHV